MIYLQAFGWFTNSCQAKTERYPVPCTKDLLEPHHWNRPTAQWSKWQWGTDDHCSFVWHLLRQKAWSSLADMGNVTLADYWHLTHITIARNSPNCIINRLDCHQQLWPSNSDTDDLQRSLLPDVSTNTTDKHWRMGPRRRAGPVVFVRANRVVVGCGMARFSSEYFHPVEWVYALFRNRPSSPLWASETKLCWDPDNKEHTASDFWSHIL